ncbi:hypothetical protein [Collimonas silvisoli]|uniref:hypothetical protein n=1 Tax=Collimonas silvisoli TaxID=2825884 RepID=UPI001B8C41C1|nr:hypothetical protein [Collimonas silvisoli]
MTSSEILYTGKFRQRGIASLLIILLVGLSMAAMVVGGMYYLRGLQAKTVTAHAAAEAQLKAWTGVEAIRQYLYQVGSDVTKLPVFTGDKGSGQIQLQGLSGVSATVMSVTPTDPNCSTTNPKGTRVNVNLTGASGPATSTVEAVYCASGSPGSQTNSNSADPGFVGDVEGSGSITYKGSSSNGKLVVQGNVTMGGSISGFSQVYATGNISLTGSNNINALFSEGDITLVGGHDNTINVINSLHNVSMGSGFNAVLINANGSVTLGGHTSADTINAIGDVSLGDTVTVGTLNTKGSVTAGGAAVTSAMVQGNYQETYGTANGGQVGGPPPYVAQCCSAWNTKVKLTNVPGLQVAVSPLTAATLSTTVIDAYAVKNSANYIFDVDAKNNIVVNVNNVNGLANGPYYLTGDGAGNQDWLCTTATYSAGTCKAKICHGFSPYTSCFSYNNGTWSISGGDNSSNPPLPPPAMAPGVVWFHGDLNLGNGTYYNTMLATGNISTGGANISYAVNFADYNNICQNKAFPGLYPTDFCATGATSLAPNLLGNVVFLAGGYVDGVFSGGVVNLSASNDTYGNIWAGDVLKTGGSTTIHGNLHTAHQSGGSSRNEIGAKTIIDKTKMSDSGNPDAGLTEPHPSNSSATVLWTHYR